MLLCDNHRIFWTFSVLQLFQTNKLKKFASRSFLEKLRPILKNWSTSFHAGSTEIRSTKLNTLFFWKKIVWLWELLINSWFNLPITQIPILLLFASAWVLYEGVFSLWVFLTLTRPRGQSEGITPWFFRYLVF